MKFFFVFTLISTASSFDDSSMVSIMSNIINYSFEASNCIYYITDGKTASDYFDRALLETNIPMMTSTFRNAFGSNEGLSKCNGYLINTDSVNFIANIYKSKYFLRYIPILILFKSEDYFWKAKLTKIDKRNYYVNVMVIEDFENDNGIINTVPKLEVVSLNKNVVLFSWSYGKTVNLNKSDFIMDVKYSEIIQDLTFKVIAFDCKPYVYLNSDGEAYEGIEFRLMKEISRLENLYIEYVYMHPTNETSNLWKLSIDSVGMDLADISLCSHWQDFAYEANLSGTYPHGQVCLTYLVPKPRTLPEVTYVFEPLTNTLWISIVSIMIVLTVVLHAVAKCYKTMKIVQHPYLDIVVSFFDIVQTNTFGCLQHFKANLCHTHLRFILTLICIQSLLLITTYSSGLSSLLAKPRYSKPITTFEDMIDQKVFWDDYDDTLILFLASSPSPVLKQLSKRYVHFPIAQKNRSFRTNRYALVVKSLDHSYVSETDDLDAHGKNHLRVLPVCFKNSYIVFPIKNNPLFMKIIDKYTEIFFNHGIMIHWYNQIKIKTRTGYMLNFYLTYSFTTMEVKALTLSKIQGSLYLLFIGHAIAILAFVFEKILHRCRDKRLSMSKQKFT